MVTERFDPGNYLARMARNLVQEFEDAGDAGTPGLIGSAREHPSRKQLARILPGFAGIGTGLVIDSFLNTSKQQDVVIFEEEYCPVFTINETAETGRFPVEGVIAAGEIKSTLDSASLEDAFEKIASVKRLRRFSVASDSGFGLGPVHDFRHFGSGLTMAGAPSEQYDQAANFYDQVYGFVLAGKGALKPTTLLSKCVELAKKHGAEAPNAVICLDVGLFHPVSAANMLASLPATASGWARSEIKETAFNILVDRLIGHCRKGRTVPTSAYDRYIHIPPRVALDEVRPL